MHRTRLIALVPAVALLGPAVPGSASADPAPGEGVQTSICDDGRTYVFTIRDRGNEEHSRSLQHAPAFTLDGGTVLQPVSGHGTTTVTDGSTIVASFPFEFDNPRRPVSGRLTTCTSVYEVVRGTVVVRVESVDVLHVSRR